MEYNLKQSVAANILIFMVDSADHRTGKTGLTLTVYLAKQGALFSSVSRSITEKGYGWYQIALTTADTDTLGNLTVYVTAASADPGTINTQVVVDNFNSLVDSVWDEVLTGVTHNIQNSAGRKLRQLAGNVVYDGTVVSSTENTLVLDSGAASTDGAYDPALVVILSGAGVGQSRLVYQYVGATRTCVVDRDWKNLPVLGDDFMVLADAGREHVNEGLARSGGTNWIQLNTNASSGDDDYLGQVVFLRSGYGEDQACRVIAYNGTTKIATIARNWHTIPNATTAYVMLPTAVLDTSLFIQKIWEYAIRSLTDKLDFSLTSAYDNAKTAATTTTVNAIPAEVWTQPVRELTNIDFSLTPESIWEYTNRTLTYSPVNTISITGTGLSFVRGDSLSYVFTGLDLTDFSKAYFTVKRNYKDLDADAIIQVDSDDGLIILNGVAIPVELEEGETTPIFTRDQASLTEDIAAGTLTLVIDSPIMAEIPYSDNTFYYDVEVIATGVLVDVVTTPFIGEFDIVRDVTKKID